MYHGNTIYKMTTDKPKTTNSTSVRISLDNKKRLADVVRERAAKEKRYVTEQEVVDELLQISLPRLERKYKA